HTRSDRDWSSDVCSSDLSEQLGVHSLEGFACHSRFLVKLSLYEFRILHQVRHLNVEIVCLRNFLDRESSRGGVSPCRFRVWENSYRGKVVDFELVEHNRQRSVDQQTRFEYRGFEELSPVEICSSRND